jgi:alginate O-acetyltransferase complex protein AlgI
MLFPTVTFAIFFMVVLPLSWLFMPMRSWWKVFILAASWCFLAYANQPTVLGFVPLFVLLLLASCLWNWVFGGLVHQARDGHSRRVLLGIGVAGNLLLLGYFKYSEFFVAQIVNGFHHVGVTMPFDPVNVVLPIAISFYTFQGMSYLIDIYRRDFEPAPLGQFLVYQSFFPHLIAGPIVRAAEFIPQLRRKHDPRRIDASRAFALVAGGLFKKLVIADFLGRAIVRPVFTDLHLSHHSSLEILVAVYGYAVQIYADFSGYTDIAIGLALLLGFRFPQNFDRPYAATSVQEFWRRWHMTLSRWLRDYLYIPLGGNRRAFVLGTGWVSAADGPGARRETTPRRGRLRMFIYGNLMLTMVLGGLWHGAGWSFLIWGGLHGAYLIAGHVWRDTRRALGWREPRDTAWSRGWRRVATFHLVCFAWIFFPTRMGDTRLPTLHDSFHILSRLLLPWNWSGGSMALVHMSVLLAIAVGVGAQYLPRRLGAQLLASWSRMSPLAMGVTLGIALLVIDVLGVAALQGRVPDFIYFQF